MVMVLCPHWIHCRFPCTFWVRTCIRHLDKSDMECMGSLLYNTFSRHLVYYQGSHGRHSSIDNPQGSMAWDLDIVQEMTHASKMSYVDVDLCAWAGKECKDPCKFYNKTMDAQVPKRSRTRDCSRRYKRAPIQAWEMVSEMVREFRAISFAILRCMGTPCKKSHIASL